MTPEEVELQRLAVAQQVTLLTDRVAETRETQIEILERVNNALKADTAYVKSNTDWLVAKMADQEFRNEEDRDSWRKMQYHIEQLKQAQNDGTDYLKRVLASIVAASLAMMWWLRPARTETVAWIFLSFFAGSMIGGLLMVFIKVKKIE